MRARAKPSRIEPAASKRDDAGPPSARPAKARQRPAKSVPGRRDWWLSTAQAMALAARTAPTLAVEVELELRSEANQRGHWAMKAERAATQREAVWMALKQWPARQSVLRLRQVLAEGRVVIVGMTIRRPRRFDCDNRASATKATRDALAKTLAVDDGDARLVFLPVAFEKAPGSSVLIEAWVSDAR